MKPKIFSLFLAIFISSNINAQLKVFKNGNSVFGFSSAEQALSTVSIGSQGKAGVGLSVKGNSIGIYSVRDVSTNWGNAIQGISPVGTANFCVGIKGDAITSKPSRTGRSYGILGTAGNATSGWNYGVFGRLYGSNNGTAVYGTVSNEENGIHIDGQYAGYFNGETKVAGDLTVTGTINGVVLGVSASNSVAEEKAKLITNSYGAENQIIDKVNNLNLMSYYFPSKTLPQSTENISSDTISLDRMLNATEIQVLEKKHYGLSASQLKEVFPDLVYTLSDGSDAINYVELIPILIQSIKELNAQVIELKNLNKEQYINGISSPIIEKSRLNQNTPNPFIDKSNITLYISSTANKASLYFYNMNGVQVKKQQIKDKGDINIELSSSDFTPGLYIYALVVDGIVVETKRMIVEK